MGPPCDGRLAIPQSVGLQFAGCLENRIGDRADVRVDALEVAQDVEMERARLYAFRAAFTQPRQMTVRTGELRGSELRFFLDERARDLDVIVDEDAEREPEVVDNALVEVREFRRSFLRELILVLDLLDGASSMRFLSMMSPICSRLMENAMISMARRPSRSSRLSRVTLVT